jgi:hypothetical protein
MSVYVLLVIHDADLEDDKFGRTEGHTMNRILQGWATKDISDEELLGRWYRLDRRPVQRFPITSNPMIREAWIS